MTKRPQRLPLAPRFVVAFVFAISFMSFPALAQEPAPSSAPNSGTSPQPQETNKAKDGQGQATKGQSNNPDDRIFYTVPNFLTVENAGQVPAITPGHKFKLVAQDSFDYFNYPWYGFLAGISQAENSEPGYGQGAAGYGKRYAATFTDGTIENFMVGAVFPSLLHQDPRYFQLGKGTFFHRSGYALSRIFITRTDSGSNQFNYSEIAGAAVSAGIANAYHPTDDRNFANTMSIWGTDLGWDAFTFVVKEFWPDIRRKLHRDKN